MERTNPWMAGLVTVIGLQSVVIGGFLYPEGSQKAEAATPGAPGYGQPAKIEHLKASNVKRVSLTARAAERLDIKTVPVREQEVVRKRSAEGVVLAAPQATVVTAPVAGVSFPEGAGAAVLGTKFSPGQTVLVRVPFAGDVDRVAQDQPVRVLPVNAKDGMAGKTAKSIKAPDGIDAKEAARALYYKVEQAAQELAPGQRVRVELELAGSGKQQRTVPHSAVIYDPRGDAWVYTNPEPLVFVRHRINVDYIEGDLAVLSDGPPAGTAVVMTGAAELFGAEYRVGY
jgi:hypothetical protein